MVITLNCSNQGIQADKVELSIILRNEADDHDNF